MNEVRLSTFIPHRKHSWYSFLLGA